MRNTLNILIGGEAGQGLVTIGQLLSKSLVRSGYFIVVTQSYQSRIRGGHNSFTIRISTEEISALQESVDILVAMNYEAVRLHWDEILPDGIIIADKALDIKDDRFMRVPFTELVPDRFSNTVALGITGAVMGLDKTIMEGTMESLLGKKKASLIQENRSALHKAFEWANTNLSSDHRLHVISESNQRLMMNGNEAIALGAVSTGLKFCSFYPMTPSTSIPLNLIAHAPETGLIVEQAEDEISAINMAIGASFAGAPSLVPTSGGGFALMVEGISLAAMTETPVLVVVSQRPGPATGLPTRTEQADLELVLHAGHGEFPRAIFCPGSVEDCFYLTGKALKLAEEYQSPVFLLTDQFLADSYRAIEPLDIETLSPVHIDTPKDTVSPPYKRYEITENGVSPRLIPGMSEHLVIADSDEHTESGHLTENLNIRQKMVKKRLTKGDGIKQEVIYPDIREGRKPNLLLVSWGSSKGAVLEAAAQMNSNGKDVATIHFSQVWPLMPDQFMDLFRSVPKVVCIESNANGQFARLIRRETGFKIHTSILRFDGLPLTPEYILSRLNEYNR
jgi:2-oxoglutarate ferredoxin oxidoreductase subunit alpha